AQLWQAGLLRLHLFCRRPQHHRSRGRPRREHRRGEAHHPRLTRGVSPTFRSQDRADHPQPDRLPRGLRMGSLMAGEPSPTAGLKLLSLWLREVAQHALEALLIGVAILPFPEAVTIAYGRPVT